MEESKNRSDGSKSPIQGFQWNIELVAEAAREVACAYKSAELWSGDLSCEKQLIRRFIKKKQIAKKMSGLIISQDGETTIVETSKFTNLIDFLTNYIEPQN